MKEIPDSMFNSIDIESIEIPNWIDDIDSDAFTDSDLRLISFEENSSVRRLGIRCFADTYIQKIVLPDSLYHRLDIKEEHNPILIKSYFEN